MTLRTKMSRSVYANRLAEFPGFAFGGDPVFEHQGGWRPFFGERIGSRIDGRIILEIGCFDAKFLAGVAAEHPSTAFIGIDWKCKAIYDGAAHIAALGLKNIVLLRARGNDLLSIFAPAELDEIWIFHPDPCDRENELKNRLVSKAFLLAAHRVLGDEASLIALKTDHQGYYQSVMDLLAGGDSSLVRKFAITANSTDFWHDKPAILQTMGRHFSGRQTPFERRFIGRRRPIYYLELQKSRTSTPEQASSKSMVAP